MLPRVSGGPLLSQQWCSCNGLRLDLEPFGTVDPPLRHPIPGGPALRIAGELRHLLAVGGVLEEFLARVHVGSSALMSTIRDYGQGRIDGGNSRGDRSCRQFGFRMPPKALKRDQNSRIRPTTGGKGGIFICRNATVERISKGRNCRGAHSRLVFEFSVLLRAQ
jgi:hypothetical protein